MRSFAQKLQSVKQNMRSFKQKFCGITAVLVMAAATAAVSPAAAVDDGGGTKDGAIIQSAPTGTPTLTAAATSGTHGSVTLTAAGVTGTVTKWEYNYKKATDTSYPTDWLTISPHSSTLSNAAVTGLTGNTVYRFKVRAVNTVGSTDHYSTESAEKNVTPTAAAPPAPTLTTTTGNSSVTVAATVTSVNGSEITKWQYTHKKSADTGDYPSFQDVPKPDITTSTATSVTFTVDGLTGGTGYKFKLRAVNRVGVGADSTETTATTSAAAAPPQPKVTASAGPASVVLWASVGSDNGSAITKWQYQYKINSNYSSWQDVSSTELFMSTTVRPRGGLANGTEYTFKVRAVNDSGGGAASDEIAVTPERQAPGAPSTSSGFKIGIPAYGGKIAGPSSVTVTRTTGSQLDVTWDSVAGAVWGYHVRYSSDGQANWTTHAGDIAANSTTITGVDDTKVYTVEVYADTPYGITTTTVSDPVGTASSAPQAPGPITVSRSGSTLSVSWTAVSGATSYDVQNSSSTTATPTTVSWSSSTNTTANSATISSIDTSKYYLVRVRAKNTAGSSDWSTSALNAPGDSTPEAPAEVTVTRSNTGTSLTVNWSASPGATAYDIQTNTKYKAGSWTSVATDTTDNPYTINSIDSDADYYVSVRASNTNGDSAWTDSALNRAIPVPAAPATATLTRRQGPNGMVMDLEWSEVPGAVAYEVRCGYIYYYSMYSCADNVTSTDTTITQIDGNSLTSSKYHFVAVRAENSSGASPWTGAFSFPAFPDPITNLTATRTTGKITLEWTVPDDHGAPIVGYDVLCSTSTNTDGDKVWNHCPGSPFTPGSNDTTGSTYTAVLNTGSANDNKKYDIAVRGNSGGVATDWTETTVSGI